MDIREDTWLANIFGCPVFKIETHSAAPLPDDSTSQLRELVDSHARQQAEALYYAKVDTKQVEVVRQLSGAGLFVVDVNVTFRIDTKAHLNHVEAKEVSGLSINEIEPSHNDATLEIAESCFQYSRFHLDPLVPPSIANRIKRDWILNYIRGQRGERLFVALDGARPVGFLAVIATETNDQRTCTIDLIGVRQDFQRLGVGRALTAFFIRHYREQCDYLTVGTQAANIPSMRLYQSVGFFISQTQYVMHGHVGHEGLNA